MNNKKLSKTSLIVKSNSLNQASFRLSITEMQLILMAIAQARESKLIIKSDLEITIKAIDFAKMFDLNEKNVYRDMREALDRLFERQVIINDIDNNGNIWVNKTRWISTSSYCDGLGSIRIVFANNIINHVTKLETEFTSYRISQIGNLSSIYAVRIYELLIQFKSTGIKIISIDELRQVLDLKNEYSLFGHFRINVIDIAIEQINKHTDIKVKYEAKKTGRKYTHLEFKFKIKEASKKLTTTQE